MAKSESTKIELVISTIMNRNSLLFTVFPKYYSQMNISVICPAMQRFFMADAGQNGFIYQTSMV